MTDHPDLVTAATHFIFTKTLSNEVSKQVEGAQPVYFFMYLYYIMHNIKMSDNDFRSKIHSALQSQRPSLSSSSLRTYTSVLYNLHSKHLNQDHNNMEWFSQNYKKILDYLNENIRKSTRKSVLSALYVLTNRPEYHEQMIEDAKDINEEYREQRKTQKQEDNWISVQQIKDKYD